MIVARFNCPACETPIEAPANSVAQGVRCPQCDMGFVPGKVQTSDEAVEEREAPVTRIKTKTPKELSDEIQREREQQKLQKERDTHERKWSEHTKLKDLAANISAITGLIILVAAIAFGVELLAESSETRSIAFTISAASFSLGLTLFIIAQLVHIRAALEKLSLKE